MSVFRDLLMTMSSGGRIPDDYQEVKYIESSGTQYIDTEYKNTTNSVYKIKYKVSSITQTWHNFFGARTTWNNSDAFNYGYSSSYNFYINIGGINPSVYSGFSLNTLYEATVEKDKTTVDGNVYTYSNSLVNGTLNVYLFALNENGQTNEEFASYKLYEFKIYDNGILQRSFVPCYKKSNHEVGLYDMVTKKFYANLGTGVFVAGPDVIGDDTPYIELGYIESTGTQYIETNYTPNNNTQVQITVSDVKSVNGIPNAVLFSASSDWDYRIYALTYQNASGVNGFRWMLPGDIVFGSGTQANVNTIKVYRGSVWFNGSTISTGTSTYNAGHLATLHICGENRYDDLGNQHNQYKTHSFKIWENNSLLMDFIPVKRKSDNVICMYDTISETFFTNAGSGDFIAGPEI